MNNQGNNRGRVFVVQKTMRWDEGRGELMPKFDLGPAALFGEIVYLLSPTASPFHPDKLMDELHCALADFSDNDHLLLVGSPVLIGMVVAIAADKNDGYAKVLQWSGKTNSYQSIQLNALFEEGGQPVD